MNQEVVVIGGGPAGTAIALSLLRLGRTVLTLERSRYERWRIGETLPPYASSLLRELSVWDRFLAQEHLPSYGIHSCWGEVEICESDFIFNPHGTGWHVDRMRFDAMLAGTVEDGGGPVLRGTRIISAAYKDDRWKILLNAQGQICETEALFLVDATGSSSRVARDRGIRRLSYDRMIALAGVLREEHPRGQIDPVLVLEAVEDGWWYSAPLPDGSLLATYVTDADYLTRARISHTAFWTARLRRTLHTSRRTRGLRLAGNVRVRVASTSRLETVVGPGWLAAGDAACAFDPLCAGGICKALEGGIRAAASINRWLAGHSCADEYSSAIVGEFDTYLKARARYYTGELRWQNSLFWKRRQNSM